MSMRNVKTSHIELRERLAGAEADWLVQRVRSKRGVVAAAYHPMDTHRLVVQYDGDVVRLPELLDHLFLCGVYPEPAAPITGMKPGPGRARSERPESPGAG